MVVMKKTFTKSKGKENDMAENMVKRDLEMEGSAPFRITDQWAAVLPRLTEMWNSTESVQDNWNTTPESHKLGTSAVQRCMLTSMYLLIMAN